MKGFFYQQEKQTMVKTKRSGGVVKKDPCENCGLYKSCETPKMPPTGQGKKGILIIAEAPGAQEDREGVQLIGRAGQLLRKALRAQGVDLDEDCWKTNAIICRPPKNKTPSITQINACRPNLIRTIEELQPEKIILLGKIALQSYLSGRFSVEAGIASWVGWKIPDALHNCWVFPTYHPAYLLRNEGDDVLYKQFSCHIQQAVQHADKLPAYIDKWEVEQITTVSEATRALEQIMKDNVSPIAIDYETTGPKPQAPGHKILTASIAINNQKAIAFPIFDDDNFRRVLRQILINPSIKKYTHNAQYEYTWTKEILGCGLEGIIFDSMLGAHILDNRPKITGLKFQAFVNYGIEDYASGMKRYMHVATSNSINCLQKAPVDELLQYNGMDAILTYNLCEQQMSQLSTRQQHAYNLFQNGAMALADVSMNGICTDTRYIKKMIRRLEVRMDTLHTKMQQDKHVQQWRAVTKKRGEFNPNSSTQIQEVLFDTMGLSPIKETATGKASTDVASLEQLRVPLARRIVQYRQAHKLSNTYLGNFLKETVDGKMHPNYLLNIARTYRSSSVSPNFQNIPKRDQKAQKITRSAIHPRPGRQILEVDYSGIEVRVSACNHHDTNMLKYIHDPTTDMHRDVAMLLLDISDPLAIKKHVRQGAKSGFVFPQFYGDYFVNCARALWDKWLDGDDKKALKSKGMGTYTKFEKHVKRVEDRFWNELFPEYTAWKERTYTRYMRRGYVDLLTGFRCYGPMRKNEVLNYPIQGPAFHCLLWSLTELNTELQEKKFDTLIIGQVHDSIVLDLVPDEFDELWPLVKEIMTQRIREEWPWIIVPLEVEGEITEIDGDWYNQREVQ